MAVGDQFADPRAALGCQISDLDAAAANHGDGARVGGVLWLGLEFDGLTWCAKLDFESPTWTPLIGKVGADDSQGKGGEGQLVRKFKVQRARQMFDSIVPNDDADRPQLLHGEGGG